MVINLCFKELRFFHGLNLVANSCVAVYKARYNSCVAVYKAMGEHCYLVALNGLALVHQDKVVTNMTSLIIYLTKKA